MITPFVASSKLGPVRPRDVEAIDKVPVKAMLLLVALVLLLLLDDPPPLDPHFVVNNARPERPRINIPVLSVFMVSPKS